MICKGLSFVVLPGFGCDFYNKRCRIMLHATERDKSFFESGSRQGSGAISKFTEQGEVLLELHFRMVGTQFGDIDTGLTSIGIEREARPAPVLSTSLRIRVSSMRYFFCLL